VSFTNNQVNFPVVNASASINNTGALINVNAIRYPNYISEMLKEYWSPEQIMGRLELDKKIKISTETAYRFVLQDKYGIFVRRPIAYIFACFTPFSCRIKEWSIYPLTD
jgi:hypothetical protein